VLEGKTKRKKKEINYLWNQVALKEQVYSSRWAGYGGKGFVVMGSTLS
jgi:hypothetical protein